VREIAEQREERLLTQILTQIQKTRLNLADLKREVDVLLKMREQELQRQTPAAQLQVTYAQMRALEIMQKDVAEQLQKLEALRLQQMKIYDAARMAREVIAEVRNKQEAVYSYEQARQEQKRLDDNFSSRRGRY
jgi:hypothetical protein